MHYIQSSHAVETCIGENLHIMYML